MSVLKSQRGESAVQFLDTARELEIYTIKTCAKFPKRYMFLITKDINGRWVVGRFRTEQDPSAV